MHYLLHRTDLWPRRRLATVLVAAMMKSPELARVSVLGAPAAGRRPWLLLFVVVCGAEVALLGALAARGVVQVDEGFYMTAGWRVLAGRRLYADFFFPQMPYLPYVEAAVLASPGRRCSPEGRSAS